MSDAARMLKLKSVPSLRIRVKNDPELNEVLEECRAALRDFALDNIQKAIVVGEDMTTTRWYLASHDPAFREVTHTKIEGSLDVNVKFDLSKLTLEELKSLEQFLEKVTIQE